MSGKIKITFDGDRLEAACDFSESGLLIVDSSLDKGVSDGGVSVEMNDEASGENPDIWIEADKAIEVGGHLIKLGLAAKAARLAAETKPEWAWMFPGDETAHGTYSSKREAIAEAAAYCSGILDDQVDIVVGLVERPDVGDFASASQDSKELIELMDELLADGHGEFFPGDDVAFAAKDKPKSEAALKTALVLWARSYVDFVGNWTLRDTGAETITLDPVEGTP